MSHSSRAQLRHRSREIALQLIYEMDMRPDADILDAIELYPSDEEQEGVFDYACELLTGVREQSDAISELLRENIIGWRPERMVAVDKAVISIALYEGVLSKRVPIPVAISEPSEDISATDSQSTHCMYLVKDMRNASDAYKGEDAVKGYLFFEVNGVNPLNAFSFELENGKLLWDVVVLFAANINYDSDAGRPFVKCNPNVQYLLDNNETFLQPLRKRGVKVLLGLLGNHDMAGLAQLSEQGAKDFAREVAQYCKAYNLDGINYDDEYSTYPDLNNPAFESPGTSAAARLCYETKLAMPDKLVTVFAYGNMYGVSEVNGVDVDEWLDIIVPNYGGSAYPIGNMTNKKCAGMALEFNLGIGGSLTSSSAQRLISEGYGWFMGFAPSPENYGMIFSRLSGASTLYGSSLKDPTIFYKKDDPTPYSWPTDM